MGEYILEMKNITKTFPGVKALDNVQLNVRAGTVHALMGENGAGKSTLMKCLFGIYKPDGGEIILQKAVNIRENDTPETLQKRVMRQAEWKILPKAIDLIANGKVKVEGGKVFIEGYDPESVL